MKEIFAFVLSIVLLTFAACDNAIDNTSQNESSKSSGTLQTKAVSDSKGVTVDLSDQLKQSDDNDNEGNSMTSINLTVGGSVFSAKLYDNDAAGAFLALFPLTLNMSDLNRNEKYYYLADNLPSKSTENPADINAGDIMCWSGNCLVLFYKTFSNSYGGYVRLGYIEDTSGLAAALGIGSADVTFTVSG